VNGLGRGEGHGRRCGGGRMRRGGRKDEERIGDLV
jgi:hypothetical protein